MIDFTTLTANPIPLPLSELESTNLKLSDSNKILKQTLSKTNILLLIVLITSVGFTIYQLKKNNNEK
jgi:hypothetical protein